MPNYRLVFFVPESHLESVKQAVFATGAGTFGNYGECCWQVLGTGQFRPLDGSDPHIGEVGELEKVSEWRVELICQNDQLKPAIEALKEAHPYEEVAFSVVQLFDTDTL